LIRALVVAAGLLAAAGAAEASSIPQGCDRGHVLTAAQQDQLLRFTAVIRQALAESGAQAALISRSGTDLSRFGLRYSHAGIAVAQGLDTPWAVRQLYYACSEGAPRLFDQGLAGFVSGSDDADVGYVSLVLLPPEAAAPLAAAVRDKPTALGLLNARYSANAYPFSTSYQNCNQWVAELLAAASIGGHSRDDAQAWLKREGYAPDPVHASGLLMLMGRFVPWLHFDDHPPAQLDAGAIQTSLPDSLEAFALRHWPSARRIELCHGPQGVLARDDGRPLAAGCLPQEGARVKAQD